MSRHPLRAVELHGRLGNQLFQYAMLRALVGEDAPVLVETIAADDAPLSSALRPGSYRRLTVAESVQLGRPPSLAGRSRRNLSGVLRRIPGGGYSGPIGRSIYRETEEGVHDPGVASVSGDVLFCGFFQNEGYFAAHPSLVADSLVPVSEDASRQIQTVNRLGPDRDLVAVVARAGADYVQLGWDLPLEWYLAAAERVAGSVPRASFVVFSDVPLAADALAALLGQYGPSHAVTNLDPVQQLHVMAEADHLVSAATSFGWWGGWLGDAARGFADRLVVVPDPWVTPGRQTPPARWTRIPVAERR